MATRLDVIATVCVPIGATQQLIDFIAEVEGNMKQINIDPASDLPTSKTRKRSGANTKVTAALRDQVKEIKGSAARIATQLGIGKSTVEGIRRGEYDHV